MIKEPVVSIIKIYKRISWPSGGSDLWMEYRDETALWFWAV